MGTGSRGRPAGSHQANKAHSACPHHEGFHREPRELFLIDFDEGMLEVDSQTISAGASSRHSKHSQWNDLLSWVLRVKTQHDTDCKPVLKMIVVCGVLGGNGGGAASALLLSSFQTHLEGVHVAYPPATVAEMVWGGSLAWKEMNRVKTICTGHYHQISLWSVCLWEPGFPKEKDFQDGPFCAFFQVAAIISFIWRCHFHKAVLSQSVQEYIPASANLQAAQKACSFNCQIYS